MVVVLGNNKRSVLRQQLASSDTLVVVSDSTTFPTLAAGEYFYLTIVRSDGASEIVKVLSVSGASLTVVRAQEGTAAREFPAGSGVEMRVTAASVLDAAQDAVDALTLGDLGITAAAAEINILDGAMLSTAELNILDGATVTAAELNILDGVTATTAELNILDGATVTAAELNILDGALLSTAELNILDGVTATTAELNLLDGVTATTAELNILDGVTATTAELNYVDGVTSPIQTQLDAKVPRTSTTGSGVLPAGTTAERDGSPSSGYIRFNTSNTQFEGYNGAAWGPLGGAGLFKGENGSRGDTVNGAGDIFRINEQTLNTNVTIDGTENASCAGPLTVASGVTLTIASGGNLVIV